METINDIVREIRAQQNGNIHTISAKEAYALADRIEAAVKALESDRDNWRRQALDEDARANAATCQNPLQVGSSEGMRVALNVVVDACDTMLKMKRDADFVEKWAVSTRNIANKALKAQLVTIGNAAKMREALDKTLNSIKYLSKIHNDNLPEDVCATLGLIAFEVSEALSAPARNFDLYATEAEAWEAYKKIIEHIPMEEQVFFETWLFAEVKGEAK